MGLLIFLPTTILCIAIFTINKSDKSESEQKALMARWIGGYVIVTVMLFWFIMSSVGQANP